MINPSHNLPPNPQLAPAQGERLPAVSAVTKVDEHGETEREQRPHTPPAETVLDGELLEELLNNGQLGGRREHTIEGATWRANSAINAYEDVRSANPMYASTSGLLLDTYA